MADQTIQEIEAVVAAKQGVYETAVLQMDPDGDPLFEVAFETAQGVKIFWINSYDYYALKVGMKGLLRYKGDQLLSFGSWIKENFSMN